MKICIAKCKLRTHSVDAIAAAAGPQDKDGGPTKLFSRPSIRALAERRWKGIELCCTLQCCDYHNSKQHSHTVELCMHSLPYSPVQIEICINTHVMWLTGLDASMEVWEKENWRIVLTPRMPSVQQPALRIRKEAQQNYTVGCSALSVICTCCEEVWKGSC